MTKIKTLLEGLFYLESPQVASQHAQGFFPIASPFVIWIKSKNLLLGLLLCFVTFLSTAQLPATLTNTRGFTDWGDFDNDGDQDILFSYIDQATPSVEVTKILVNNGGAFTASADTLTQSYARVRWGDFDNDGDLDFAQIGSSSGVYRNNGGGSFTKLPAVIANYVEALDWGDFDNDGDLDLAVAGTPTGTYFDEAYIRIYRNVNGSFSSAQSILSVPDSLFNIYTIHWVDYDNDGDLDLSFSNNFGGPGNFPTIKGTFIINNSGGVLTDTGVLIEGANAAWGDYDQDGDLDIGCTRPLFNGYVYFANTNGLFTNAVQNHWTVPVLTGLSAFGDFNNDGALDHAQAGGFDGTSQEGGIFTTLGSPLASAVALGTYGSPVSGGFADYDNDGDLDFLISGNTIRNGDFPNFETKIITSTAATANTSPTVPTGLVISFLNSDCTTTSTPATFSWNASTDNETAAVGLTYNLRIGTTPGGNEVISIANSLKPVMGNVQQNTQWIIQGLNPNINYYWSVEAVDNSFQGSGYAVEQIYTPPVGASLFSDSGFTLPGIGVGSVMWGDYDKDGDMDILSVGNLQAAGGTGSADIYRNDGTSFVAINAGFTPVTEAVAQFVDYDNDNDLDVCLMGKNAAGNPILVIYRNTNGTYLNILNTGLPGLYDGSMAWADFDGDSRPDLAVIGKNNVNFPITRMYKNLGNKFEEIQANLPGMYNGDIAWQNKAGGLPDLIISGKDETHNDLTRYYRNDAEQQLTSISLPLSSQVSNSTIAANNIAFPNRYEYMIMGTSVDGTSMQHFMYDSLTEIQTGLTNGDALWIDYDNDGDNDVVISGVDVITGNLKTLLYQNINDNYGLICSVFPLEGDAKSRIATADYDNDGDLDLVFTSYDALGQAFGKIYSNQSTVPNTPPTTPQNFTLAFDDCNTITLTWDAAMDAQAQVPTLTYNVMVGTTLGGSDILSPTALTNGERLVNKHGNTGLSLTTSVNVSAEQIYYFGVQAIDNGFQSSAFAMDAIAVSPSQSARFDEHQFTNNYVWNGLIPIDVDANGYQDILAFRLRIDKSPNTVFKNTNSALSATDALIPHTGFSFFSGLDDYDKDGDLDLFYNFFNADSAYFYLNNGQGNFTPTDRFHLQPDSADLRFIYDFNHDGYNDYILSSINAARDTVTWLISLTDRNGIYDRKVLLKEPTQYSAHIRDIVDYNNDGFDDLLITFHDSSTDTDPGAIFYRNDQNTGFTPTYQFPRAKTPRLDEQISSWGDFDNDGDLDLLLLTYDDVSDWRRSLTLFRNDGSDSFSVAANFDFDPSYVSSGTYIGDFDNDGDLDIITKIRSIINDTDDVTIFENQGGFQFEIQKICIGKDIPHMEGLIDIDNDNDLDIIISDVIISYDTANVSWSAYYKNLSIQQNSPPQLPPNLGSVYNVGDSSLTLSWSAATDAQTPSAGLSYNIRIGMSAGAVNLIHPKSIVGGAFDGKRQVVALGNVGQVTTWKLNNVTPGQDYYWSVQAIDHSYVGSPFAIEQVTSSNRSTGTGTLSGIMGSGSGSSGGRVISGRKMDVDDPIANVRIALVNISTGYTLLLDKTDSKGNFDFLDVPNGAYKVHVDYNNLPMDENNPTINFVQDAETIEVTVLVNGGKLSVSLNSSITATEDEILQNQIQIFPNPTSGFVNIRVQQPAKISLISLTGRLLDTFSLAGEDEATLNTSSYPPGLYILRITTEKAYVNYKLVKQ